MFLAPGTFKEKTGFTDKLQSNPLDEYEFLPNRM